MRSSRKNPGLWRVLRSWIIHSLIRVMLVIYSAALKLAKLMSPKKRRVQDGGLDILLTGTFHSENWIKSHLWPLSLSTRVKRIRMVATSPVPVLDKVEGVYPPQWLVRIGGEVPARLLMFLCTGWRTRPDIVGGFHLLLTGMAAAFVGKAIGARSLYICGGGPAEVAAGGIMSENRLFQKLETADPIVERRLLRIVSEFDFVITMGQRSAQYFRDHGVNSNFFVISGGRDGQRFHPDGRFQHHAPATDVVFTGRLAAIKRVDLFLRAVAEVARELPELRAAIIGEGPLEPELKHLAHELGIGGNVIFAGQQRCVEAWLAHSRVLVLTSDSEGLSLALMEAMLCGLPAVVSDVGDLCELVIDNINGYLITERTPSAFAERILQLLKSPESLAQFSIAARQSAQRFDVHAAGELWDHALAPEFLQGQVGRTHAVVAQVKSTTQKGVL